LVYVEVDMKTITYEELCENYSEFIFYAEYLDPDSFKTTVEKFGYKTASMINFNLTLSEEEYTMFILRWA
jgi:hypothetical protein